MSSSSSDNDVAYNIENNAELLFARLKLYICIDIVTYIEKIFNIYINELTNTTSNSPQSSTTLATTSTGSGYSGYAGGGYSTTTLKSIERDINRLILFFICILQLLKTETLNLDNNIDINYKKINYNIFKHILFDKYTGDSLDNTPKEKTNIIKNILLIIKNILLNENYITLNYLYGQICINIYLSETKDMYINSDYIENKMDSILYLIMRLFTNTLEYYLYNISKYIIPDSSEDNNKQNYNSLLQNIVLLKEFNLSLNGIDENEIYKKIRSNVTKDDVKSLCDDIYYKNKGSCNSNNYSANYTNLKKIGGSSITLSKISYNNPLILLNNINMDLCKLIYIYTIIHKNIILKNTSFFNIINKYNENNLLINSSLFLTHINDTTILMS